MTTRTEPTVSISDARHTAQRAQLVWFDTALTQLTGLADRLGVTGHERAVVFTATENAAPGDWEAWREQLSEVTFAGVSRDVVIGPENPLWPAVTSLWIDLRAALAAINGSPTAPGILIDLHHRTLGTWDVWFCPDVGPLPDHVQVVPTLDEHDAAAADPLRHLLDTDPEVLYDLAHDRVLHMLELHELEPPSEPGHEAGICAGEVDDDAH